MQTIVHQEILLLLRNIFLRMFAVGFALFALLALLTLFNWENVVALLTRQVHITTREALGAFTIDAFLNIRFFLLFCLLTPALALHWTLHVARHHTKVKNA